MTATTLCCFRLTTATGSIVELWELDSGEFELLFVEAHRPDDVVGAFTFTLTELELLVEKGAVAAAAVRNDT